MTPSSDQKIVLITGANKGIGFATARVLAEAGHVVLLGARNPERGAAAEAALTGRGLDARYVHLDVTDTATVTAAAKLVDSDYGRLDILVNNAAVTRDSEYPPTEMPVEVLREAYETNVLGVVAVTNAMLPLLRRSPSGHIGNVSSALGSFAFLTDPGLLPYANLLAYNSSKAALNALSPGFCATDLNEHTGVLSADEGGRHVADQVTLPPDGPTGVFLHENGGTYPW